MREHFDTDTPMPEKKPETLEERASQKFSTRQLSWINKHYISRENLPKRKRNSSHFKWLQWATKEPYNRRERIAFKRGYNHCLADFWKTYKQNTNEEK